MERTPILETCHQIIDKQIPNLFRLFINPYVAQSCLCLSRLVETTWQTAAPPATSYQVFLANGMEEALSGAVKLARYVSNLEYGTPSKGIVLEADDPRLKFFAAANLEGGKSVTFIPDLELISPESSVDSLTTTRFCVLPIYNAERIDHWQWIRAQLQYTSQIKIVLATRETLDECRRNFTHPVRSIDPDIIVFDESFVNSEVPFAAFVAKKKLYEHWNKPGMKLFHSTTYQPNTISSMHFVRSLDNWDPTFVESLRPELDRLLRDFPYRQTQFASLYSTSLTKLTKLTNLNKSAIFTDGHYISVGGHRIFDGVGGVACSIRGHNPRNYIKEVQALDWQPEHIEAELQRRLHDLTGLDHFVPAVSGASAVETALKIGLMANSSRSHIIALRGGFGGKTLLSLTGTWKPSLRRGIDPLYPQVDFIDPFSESAVSQLEGSLNRNPTAIVQLEVIQGVGGVRKIPQTVLEFLASEREKRDFLLFVDEVQTGFFRTGPFIASHDAGLKPDLLTLGKGASDMMFPFALTLYSESIQEQLDKAGTSFVETQKRYGGYSLGYKTVLNTLIKDDAWDQKVRAAGDKFAELLRDGLKGHIQEIRCYGLLIGIELIQRRFCRKLGPQIALLKMLEDRDFPVLMGFCQYEPHVLKFTPPLTTNTEEIEKLCWTIINSLRMPLYRGLMGTLLHAISTQLGIRS
ncbi:MAG: aminotransferase class III-fold pyridoxal phosphate-dependent enzyme [Planctomycetaceae bacterium]|nr:aminotransferase class III-fold pyridoxal phosphate-dependent enzyme [Planctomycetaceae bacterium]